MVEPNPKPPICRSGRSALSLLEMIAVLAILGVLAACVIPRLGTHHISAKRHACWMNKAEIELQVQLWHRNNGSFPAADLSDIGSDQAYFPEGVPTCPADGTAYTIDTTSGLVTGHTH